MTPTPAAPLTRPRMTKTLWLTGIAVALALWLLIVGLVGWASGRPAEVASDGRLLAGFCAFVLAWTGGWVSSARPAPRG